MKLKQYITEGKKDKVGSIVYHNDGKQLHFMFMIPSDPAYGGTDPQISKGHIDGGETPIISATREAEEELGLKKTNINSITLLKRFKIVGMTRTYSLQLFGIEINNMKDFNSPHYETGRVLWLKENQLNKVRSTQRKMVLDGIDIIKNNL